MLLSQVLNIFGKLRDTTTALAQKPVFFHWKSTTDVNLLIFLFVGWHCQKILTTLTLHAKSFYKTPVGISFEETHTPICYHLFWKEIFDGIVSLIMLFHFHWHSYLEKIVTRLLILFLVKDFKERRLHEYFRKNDSIKNFLQRDDYKILGYSFVTTTFNFLKYNSVLPKCAHRNHSPRDLCKMTWAVCLSLFRLHY